MPTDYSYNLVAQNPTSTVVAQYPPEGANETREKQAEYYQSAEKMLDGIYSICTQ